MREAEATAQRDAEAEAHRVADALRVKAAEDLVAETAAREAATDSASTVFDETTGKAVACVSQRVPTVTTAEAGYEAVTSSVAAVDPVNKESAVAVEGGDAVATSDVPSLPA